MKVAMLTTRLFDIPASGGEICTIRLMQTLRAAGHKLVCIGRGGNTCDVTGTISLDSAAVVPFDELPTTRKALAMAVAIAQGQASTVQRVSAGGAARRAKRALSAMAAAPGSRPDVLFVDHLQAFAWVADAGADLPPVVLVMHNREAEGYAERSRRLPGRGVDAVLRRRMLEREAMHLLALESVALRRASAIACLSEEDAEYYRQRVAVCGSDAPVVVLPGYPLAPPLDETRLAPPGTGRRIGMIGTWTWGPNRDALRWMLESVVPLWQDECTLVLAGSGLDVLPLPERVVSLGRIDRVSAFYSAMDVLAVPSLHGSGVQEKAIEAIGSGRTVVATRHAMRGLPGLLSQVHEAEEAGQFARLCAEAPTGQSAVQLDELLKWSERRRTAYGAAVDCCISEAVRRRAVAIPYLPLAKRVAQET